MPPTHVYRCARRALRALFTALAVALVASASAAGSTLSVDDDGADCPNARYSSLQAAIDQAAPYDTVAICPGTYSETAAAFEGTGRNGLLIRKNLTLKGAGADKVFIEPSATTDTLAGPTPTLRDGGGNVITVARQSLGSTAESEIAVTISGVTVRSPAVYAEAGIAFNNTSGRIVNSVVGPLRRASSSAELTARPLGWGIVMSNSYIGVGSPGAPFRRVRVESSRVAGYQSGGVLIDAAREAAPTTRSGMVQIGEIADTVVEGSGPHGFIPQVGVRYHAGARGFVESSRITGNAYTTGQRESAGILLTDAATDDDWSVADSVLTGNGYGVFNANIDDTAVREGAPADASGNYWGPVGPPREGPSELDAGIEGLSGDDTAGDDSVIFEPFLFDAPTLTAGPLPVEDLPPTVAIGDPVAGSEVSTDAATPVNVGAGDDFGVKQVSLRLGDAEIGSDTEAPYEFEVAAPEAMAGTTQPLTATATDSSGQTTAETISVSIVDPSLDSSPGEPAAPQAPAGDLPALLLRQIAGLQSGSVRPERPLDLTLDTDGATRATYKLGEKVICQPGAAPFTCTYLPTTNDVGRRTLTVTIADDLGRTTFRELVLNVQRFRGATVKARAVRKSGGRIRVGGSLVRPARVSARKGCAAGEVAVRVGKRKRTVELDSDCDFATTLRASGRPSVKFLGNSVLLPSNAARAGS